MGNPPCAPNGALAAPVPDTATAAILKGRLVEQLSQVLTTARNNASAMRKLGSPRIRAGASIAAAFDQSFIELQVLFEREVQLADVLPTADAAIFVQKRAVLASDIEHWAAKGNVDVGTGWALDDASGGAIHKASATDPTCRMWFTSGD